MGGHAGEELLKIGGVGAEVDEGSDAQDAVRVNPEYVVAGRVQIHCLVQLKHECFEC